MPNDFTKEEFFKRNPYCCFCGGNERASTQDHQPARVFFSKRIWPEGYIFPACQKCNDISAESEKLLACLSIMTPADAQSVTLFESFKKMMPEIIKDHGNVLDAQLTTREARRACRDHGFVKPEGMLYKDLPIASVRTGLLDELVQIVGRKMGLAFYYFHK